MPKLYYYDKEDKTYDLKDKVLIGSGEHCDIRLVGLNEESLDIFKKENFWRFACMGKDPVKMANKKYYYSQGGKLGDKAVLYLGDIENINKRIAIVFEDDYEEIEDPEDGFSKVEDREESSLNEEIAILMGRFYGNMEQKEAENIHNYLVNFIGKNFNVQTVALFKRDMEKKAGFESIATFRSGRKYPISHSYFAQVLRAGIPIYRPVNTEEEDTPNSIVKETPELRRVCFFPLKIENTTFGILYVDSDDSETFSERTYVKIMRLLAAGVTYSLFFWMKVKSENKPEQDQIKFPMASVVKFPQGWDWKILLHKHQLDNPILSIKIDEVEGSARFVYASVGSDQAKAKLARAFLDGAQIHHDEGSPYFNNFKKFLEDNFEKSKFSIADVWLTFPGKEDEKDELMRGNVSHDVTGFWTKNFYVYTYKERNNECFFEQRQPPIEGENFEVGDLIIISPFPILEFVEPEKLHLIHEKIKDFFLIQRVG